ncbi:MAG: TATA-box-binding protein [Candidatus Aenigmarchaeota archaeon]|nr:TATA-box-binding protein [Candidatus Aenigmarchaeota archaeon]
MVEFHIKVENVVAFAVLGKRIVLNKLVEKMENTEYEPEQFPGLVYRIKDPRAAALIFSSGKIVCTGAKSIAMSKEAMRKIVLDIKKTGTAMPTKFNITIENIVASTKIDVKPRLMLEEIAMSLEEVEYEPEQFPGLVYRMKSPRTAFLLFGSGKIICTGGRSLEDINTALNNFRKRLQSIGLKVKPAKDDKPKIKD